MTNNVSPLPTPPPSPSLKTAMWYWLKLGCISFGGPAGQISLMHEDLVDKKRWISEKRFFHALNYTMVLPGPEAQQLATYIGWLLHGTWGGIIAGSLFILPSFILICALAWLYLTMGDTVIVSSILYGIKPAVGVIIIFSAYKMGRRMLKTTTLIWVAVASLIGIAILKLPFPYIVIKAGLLGWMGSFFRPHAFKVATGKNPASKTTHSPCVIDDHTPTPAHAKFHNRYIVKNIVRGLSVWVASYLAITLVVRIPTLTAMADFFTQTALITFGGAYAVLPHVMDNAVTNFGWLTITQMMDGLALGETTPGPLIMIVTFVGFIGGLTKQIVSSPFLSALLGASVATWFTFLPSFLFIIVGGPVVESSRSEIKWSGPLTAISAAVVGAIVYLGLVYVYHILWPQGFGQKFDWMSALMTLLYAGLWIRLKRPSKKP
jgi:chromate transporter